MSRRTTRIKRTETKTLNHEKVFQPGLRNKRNQSLIEDQEVEIQTNGHHKELSKTKGKRSSKQSLHWRDGSLDSAISSNSTQCSVPSNVSFVSRITRSMSKKLQANEGLSSISEHTPEPDFNQTSKRNNVSHDTLTWIKKLPDTPKEGNFNEPYITTTVYEKDEQELDFICQKCAFQGISYKHETLVYLHVFIFTVLYSSTRESINASVNMNGSNVPIELTITQHLIVQSLVYIFLGVLSDIFHCTVGILLPQIMVMMANISILYNIIPLGMIKTILSFSSGIMGWQLILAKSQRVNNASILSRLGFMYSLAFILQPTLIHGGQQLLGHYIFKVLVPVVCCISLTAVIYLIPTNGIHSSSAYDVQWQKLIGYIIIKMLSTAPVPLLLLAMHSILSKNMGLTFTIGTHVVPVLVVPVISFCTKVSSGLTGLGFILILLYVILLWIDSMDHLVLMLVPVSGLIAISQNFILTTLLSAAPLNTGLICAVNLVLHTLIRYLMPMTLIYMESLCVNWETGHVFVWSISRNSTFFYNQGNQTSDIMNLIILLEETVTSLDFKILACNNLLIHTIAVTGFISSCGMLLLSMCIG